MSVSHAMNGAKVPNWVKLVVLGLGMGWVAATQWVGSKDTQDNLGNRMTQMEAKIDDLKAQSETNLQAVHARLDLLETQGELNGAQQQRGFAKVRAAVGHVDSQLNRVETQGRKR